MFGRDHVAECIIWLYLKVLSSWSSVAIITCSQFTEIQRALGNSETAIAGKK